MNRPRSLASSLACSIALVLALASLSGCAPEVEPLRVRAADLGRPDARPAAAGQPVVVEFQEGDQVPIDLTFTGDLVDLAPPAPPLAFRARRHFFVRLSKDGLAVSLDGVHFGERPKEPGAFRLGFSATPQGTRFHVDIKTPKHAAPGG